jgi:Flp pilus assembly protein TadG
VLPRLLQTKFVKSSAGVTAVEFSLVLPVLIAIIMGCIEFGLLIFSYNSVQNASRDTIRQIATNRIPIEQASTAVNANVPNWLANKITVAVSQTNTSDASQNQITLVSEFAAKGASPTSFLGWAYSNLILRTQVAMQQEQKV